MSADEDLALANLRRGALEYCLLALLDDREMYGLELAQRLGDLGLIAGEGTIYPLLSRLRRSGLVTSQLVIPDAGRSRRYYTLTAQGRASLATFTRLWTPFATNVTSLIEKEPR